MRPERRKKQAKRVVFSSDEEDISDGDDGPVVSKKMKATNLNGDGDGEAWCSARVHEEEQQNIPPGMTDEEMEKQIAFCCFNCYCPNDHRAKVPSDDRFIISSSNGLYHRRCCHGVIDAPRDDWCSPFEDALFYCEDALIKSTALSGEVEIPPRDQKHVGKKRLIQVYGTAKSQESEIYNSAAFPGKFAVYCADVSSAFGALLCLNFERRILFTRPLLSTLSQMHRMPC